MPSYETQARAITEGVPAGQVWIEVDIFRDGEWLTTIMTRHNANATNRSILDEIKGQVLRHAKVDAGIIEADRSQELAEVASGRKFDL